MNDSRSASTTGTAASLPDHDAPEVIGEIAAGAREARFLLLLALSLSVPAALGVLSCETLKSRGPIVGYVPDMKGGESAPIESESP